MRDFIFPSLFLIITIFAVVLNFLALIGVFSLFLTLPILFISIYLTLFTLTSRHAYRGLQRRNF